MAKYASAQSIIEKYGVVTVNTAMVQINFIANELAAQDYRNATTDEERKAIVEAAQNAIKRIAAPYHEDENNGYIWSYAQTIVDSLNKSKFSKEVSPPFLLLGFPGHGKTSCLVQAAKTYAEERGLEFVVATRGTDPNAIDYDRTFVMCSLELGGQATATSVAGLPVYDSEKKTLSNKVPAEIETVSRAKHGFLLLDDLANAMPEITSALHTLLIERKSSALDLTGKSIAATGNLGYDDNTAATQLSSAIFGRMATYYIVDDKDTFVARLRKKDPATADIMKSFFSAFDDPDGLLFGAQEKSNAQIARASAPRNWENVLNVLKAGNMLFDFIEENKTAYRTIINAMLMNNLPQETATKFINHLDSLRLSIYPIAKSVYENGGMNNTLQERYQKTLALGNNDIATQSNREMLTLYIAQMFLDDYLSENVENRYNAVKKAIAALSCIEPNQNTVDSFLLSVAFIVNDGRMNEKIGGKKTLENFFATDSLSGGYVVTKEMVHDFGGLIKSVIEKEGEKLRDRYGESFDQVVQGLRAKNSNKEKKAGYMLISRALSEAIMENTVTANKEDDAEASPSM